MESRGHKFRVLARERNIIKQLLDYNEISFYSRGKGSDNLIGKLLNLFSVCMLIDLPAISYLHDQRIYNMKRHYQKVSKASPIIGSISVKMLSGPKVRVVFARIHSNPEKWLAIVCIDLKLSPDRYAIFTLKAGRLPQRLGVCKPSKILD
mgnify:CR=1 FL=1